MIELPVTTHGLLIAVALIAIGIVAIYATSVWTIVLGVIVIAVVGYLLYVVGYRIDDTLKNGF